MRAKFFFTVLAAIAVNARAAESVQSDCKAIEMKVLKNKALIDRVSPGAKLVAHDCTVVRSAKGAEKLLALFHLNGASEVETRIALYNRHGFYKDSPPLFVSDSIGFDSFAIVANGKHRLIFVMPGGDGGKLTIYTNTQMDATNTRFVGWELDLAAKSLSELKDHVWTMPGGKQPKIYKEKGKWRAIIGGKIADI